MQERASGKTERASLRPLLEPASVALIGASDDPNRIGGRPIRYMLEAGYAGPIYPVNPNRDVIQGLTAYPSIAETPEPVDCAIVAVPAKIVAETLEACAGRGVKSAIVYSSGFSEVGGDGKALQAELTAIAERTGLRILGPNCLGVLSFRSRFFATFSSTGEGGYTEPGPVAIISQSGAYGTHLYAVARSWGLGVSHVITTGNECDVDVPECISWAAESEDVKVIAAYAEGIKDGPALLAALEKARAARKPVIFMKVGRSEEGAAAAASHTASLAGADEIYDAAFRQYGAHRADTTEEMLDIAYACTGGIFPAGRRIGIVTISGGVGAQMADYSVKRGLDVAPMPEDAQAELKELIPFAAPRNPVDATAQIFNDLSLIGKNFTIMLEAGEYEIGAAFFTVAAAAPAIVEPLLDELQQLRKKFPDRLLILSLMGPPEIVARYRGAGYLTFEDPCRAIAAASALAGFGESFARASQAEKSTSAGKAASASELPARALSEWESRQVLESACLPLVRARLVESAADAEKAARDFGAPAAMKINGAQFAHKTEIGGVALNVAPEDAGKTFDDLAARAGNAQDGVIVAPMAGDGVETILGVQVDPVFGPSVMFGLGGVFTEVFKDVSFRIAPFGRDEAFAMIAETKGAALLEGVRGRPRADTDALVQALVALSDFAHVNADNLASVDLNPFLVLGEGDGALALDALVVPRAADQG